MVPRLACLAFLALAAAAPAHATGGVSCEAEDRSAKFTIGSPVGRSTGGALFQFEGALELKGRDVAEDFRKLSFAKENLTQSWFDARELRMRVYHERAGEPHGTVELTVEARGNPEAETWRGRYTIRLGEVVNGEFRTRQLNGRVSCSVEG
ncbi:hypothetical protein [Phreatobacter oligotrophus]|uniref:hypothetical protein n=1 Tax=Phreatobacter oligotrophus TaxID=1122261 RepID=UPI002352EA01|nr:hypothetical protein [Phreatobacter oligotrophus]MBX9989600.1 hypothetical protein [Phreatobacter oligotrophus]